MTDSAQPFGDVADDARVSETPLVDKGFASVRKIGNGLYATISDLSKGDTTVCNGRLSGGAGCGTLGGRIRDTGRRVLSNGRAAHGEPGAGKGGAKYAPSSRPLDRECFLRHQGHRGMGAPGSGEANCG
jgi:hypothetical protein